MKKEKFEFCPICFFERIYDRLFRPQMQIVIGEEGFIPIYSTKGSAGMDLHTIESGIIKPLERRKFDTGIKIKLPKGSVGDIRPRSGLATKYGITVINTPGSIDSDYIGNIGVTLVNLSNESYEINKGDRIAQLVILPCIRVGLNFKKKLKKTKRGSGGFGSTGK